MDFHVAASFLCVLLVQGLAVFGFLNFSVRIDFSNGIFVIKGKSVKRSSKDIAPMGATSRTSKSHIGLICAVKRHVWK